ncbi:hypothetical protein KC343_g5354 [Hortaea werneckii]|nr:hypothetical protein KC352_g3934 [Hortaea werneckii]KAI7573093.1 hypothetical protein KC317_g177 [Hortaea werneckii]KAI7618928.1 hypothetical protein KC346_g4787 [Hortaea werneckii]KAI7629223.1 hypothetical protein KC343_g5354 [Hortaea werneckii]KAI7681688.1 hypothetical protein KC319_g1435 [Hortaea werneckii]
MNAKALRRLAADHSALYTSPLPPNYLFDPQAPGSDDLTVLDLLLAGPTHTPFTTGVFKLHLSIPSSYPSQPPTAFFRTPIFHPNVDPQTGGVCVETLKRDWDVKLTLRDILVVIGCLLIQPNPDSALNAEAGSLIQDDFQAFARRAEMMTGIHARVPARLKEAVKEAQGRGREDDEVEHAQRDGMRRVEQTGKSRRQEAGPSDNMAGRTRQQGDLGQPFVLQNGNDDPFGAPQPARRTRAQSVSDTSIADATDQENDELRSPQKSTAPKSAATPRRPEGATARPLGELEMEDEAAHHNNPSDDSSSSDMEPEYPPSPAKSPRKSPKKQPLPRQLFGAAPPLAPPGGEAAEGSSSNNHRNPAFRRPGPNITPPTNFFPNPLAADSPFSPTAGEASHTPSPRKVRACRPPQPSTPPMFNAPRDLGRRDGGRAGGGGTLFSRAPLPANTSSSSSSSPPAPQTSKPAPEEWLGRAYSEVRRSRRRRQQMRIEPSSSSASSSHRHRHNHRPSSSPPLASSTLASTSAIQKSGKLSRKQVRRPQRARFGETVGATTPRDVFGVEDEKAEEKRRGKQRVGVSSLPPPSFGPVSVGKEETRVEMEGGEGEGEARLEARLWESCGGDVRRWNKGDFDARPPFFRVRAARW